MNNKINDLSEYHPSLSGPADLEDFDFSYNEDYFKKDDGCLLEHMMIDLKGRNTT